MGKEKTLGLERRGNCDISKLDNIRHKNFVSIILESYQNLGGSKSFSLGKNSGGIQPNWLEFKFIFSLNELKLN